ncbi:hypothetical protein FACS1894103_0760 [Campylobacterota bacterium]|nr:hypothetical protein FACS1894103_0760 [Campylobacterota bacterium]
MKFRHKSRFRFAAYTAAQFQAVLFAMRKRQAAKMFNSSINEMVLSDPRLEALDVVDSSRSRNSVQLHNLKDEVES